ncbi:MAG TPA: ABC transporter permease [Tenericutes bacterium]|nr:ABC transporter permease [Mycoplasmatota bacterium]
MLKEHIKSFHKIFQVALIDLKKVYRGAALGWVWLIIKPATTIFIYWFAFEIGLRVGRDVNGYPYYLWLVSGLLPWFYISEIINISPDAFRRYNYLVTKMKFDISIIPTFLSMSRLIVNLMITAIVLVIYYLMTGGIDIYFYQLPLYIFLMFVTFSLIGNIFAMIGSLSKDFSNLIKTLPTILLFLSAIFWETNNIKIPWVREVQKYNLITYFTTGYRNIFIRKIWFYEDIQSFIIVISIIILLLVIASFLYKKLKKEIPDYL